MFEGQVVLVTGAAQGAGAAQARIFAERGASVIVADVQRQQGTKVAEEIGRRARFVELDVADEASWAAVIDETERTFGPVSILVNNAAIVRVGSIMDTSLEDYMRTIKVNQVGCFLGMRAVIPAMKAAGKGVIVNISSTVGIEPLANMTSYVASKWAVRGMSRTAALELGHDGIRVVCVCPANIQSPMALQEDFANQGAPGDYFSRLPIPRQQTPEELSRVIAFTASEDAVYITGSDLVVDGGTTAGHIL